jgi:antitoxin component of RelBE/YafQ-DinJ toxin-antitoxin module
MESQLTVRLSREVDRRLREEAKRLGLKRSDIARLALQRFLMEEPLPSGRTYDRVAALLGRVSTGVADLGERHRDHLIKRLKRSA